MDVLEKTETISLTTGAANMIRNLLTQKNVPDYGLRVFVSGGGCSGMQYGMALKVKLARMTTSSSKKASKCLWIPPA